MVSIVATYFNRKAQLLLTLASIRKFGNPEIIIVDDGSHEVLSLEGVRSIRIEPFDKWWTNPCIPYNIGFSKVTGDVVIIQNSECLHTGDILSYADKIKDDEMYSFGAYSLDYYLNERPETVNPEKLRQQILKEPQRIQVAHHGWYNHSAYRPVGYHFCNMITRKTLERIGGFDERFAHGICFDDDEILLRIKRSGIKIIFIDDPFVIHQKHERTDYKNLSQYRAYNEALFDKVKQESYIKPPENKVYGVL